MYYIVNDLHGSKTLIDGLVKEINRFTPDDTLIINGDGAGARGPRMNNLVKIFYEVRRGETDEAELFSAVQEIIGEKPEIEKAWIYDTVHAGLFRKLLADRYEKFADCLRQELLDVLDETLRPISEAAKAHQVRVLYLPGNGEITPDDFSTADISTEIATDPENRFYQKIASGGYFKNFGIEYVPYATELENGAILLSTNLLDLDETAALKILEKKGLLRAKFSKVIVHYPPAISPIGGAFSFWTPNKMDIKRSDALHNLLGHLDLTGNAQIYFGHIHLGSNDARMAPYPSTMGFRVKEYQCTWVKPGTVLRI